MAGVPATTMAAPTQVAPASAPSSAAPAAKFVGIDALRALKAKSPAAANMSDAQFALALHEHYYQAVPLADFLKNVGLDRGDVLYETRNPGDTYGDYARKALAAPGAGETSDQAAMRQGGFLPTDKPSVADGLARAYLQGGSLGFGDELVAAGAAALDPLVRGDSGKDFGQRFQTYLSREQGKVDQFRQDNPVAAYGAEIAGSLPTMFAVPVPGGAGVGGVLGRVGANALEGGVYGFGSTDGDLSDRAAGAGIGMGVGASLGAVGEGAGKLVSNVIASNATKKAVQQAVASAPSAAAIKASSKAAFRASEGTGAQIGQRSLQSLARDARQLATDEGLLLPSGAVTDGYSKAAGALRMIDEYARGNITMKQAQALLKTVRGVAELRDSEGTFGKKLVKAVIDHFDALRPNDFAMHPASAAGQPLASSRGPQAIQFWKQAMSDWARYKRTDMIEKIANRAQYARGGYVEGLRAGFRKMMMNERKQEGFSANDLAAIDKFVKGGPADDLLRFIQRSNPLGAAFAGHQVAGLPGAIAAAGAKLAVGGGAGAARNAGARQVASEVRARAAGAVLPPNVIPLPPRVPVPLIGRAAAAGGLSATDDPRQQMVQILVSGGRR